jgi:hypothetical protein
VRLDRGHELGLAVSTTAAYLTVLLGGALPAPAWLVALAPLLASALKVRGRTAPPISGIVIGFAALSVGVATLVTRGTGGAVIGGTYAVMGLLAARLLSRSTYAHDVQALLLALVIVLAGAALNPSISYAATFLVFAIAAVFTLTTRQLLESARRTFGDGPRLESLRGRTDVLTPRFLGVMFSITIVVLVATAAVFAAFPRVGFGSLSALHRPGGAIPDDVTLSSGAVRVLGEGKVVARLRGVGRAAFDRGLYLRGPVYDVLTESGFAKAPFAPAGWAPISMGPEREVYEVELQPIAAEVLFGLGDVWSLRSKRGGRGNPNLRLGLAGQDGRGVMRAAEPLTSALTYEVSGTVAEVGFLHADTRDALAEADDDYRAHFLLLPEGLDPRVQGLADRLTADAKTPHEKSARLRAHLTAFTYTLDDKPSTGAPPLVDFLFEHQTGHCEFFATAYAILLRASGIPARVVGGFAGGAWDNEGRVIVFTGGNAHVWVEWLDPDRGWVLEDATPPAARRGSELEGAGALLERLLRFWDDQVVDYAFADQQNALRTFGGLLRGMGPVWIVLGALIGLVVVVMLLRRLRLRRRAPARHPLALALDRYVSRRRGAAPAPAETLREAAATLTSEDDRVIVEQALALYERDRFGDGVPPARVRAAARALDQAAARR